MTPVFWPRNPDMWNVSIRKAIQTELHPDYINREEGFSLNISWRLLFQTMKKRQKAIPKDK
jgi:hypothetical protein